MTNPLFFEPISFNPMQGGALDWFDHLDDKHRVCVRFLGPPYPENGTARQRETWLIQRLQEKHEQGFFFLNLARKGMALDFQDIEVHPSSWPDWRETLGTVPLAQLFLLPNENPAEELAQMKEFLTWLDARLDNQGPSFRDGSVQWYRDGYEEAGLEAAGFEDEAKQDALTQDLQSWREKPWFEAWYRANLAGFGKLRLGPHCWSSLRSLVACRAYDRLAARKDLPPLSDEELGLT